jgi:transmembrane sensor
MMEINFESYLRYVRGEASLEEAKAVRAWLTQPTNELVAQYWMSTYASMAESEAERPGQAHDYDSMLADLRTRIGLDVLSPKSDIPAAGRKWYRWAAAAALTMGMAGAGSWWFYQQQQVTPLPVQYSTDYAQTRLVHLPDGSDVTLNAHSTLRYTGDWSRNTQREVWLDGEAYFAVKHLPTHQRFIVHTTAGFKVEVLGTKFTVYRRQEQARVVLLSGKVRVAFADSTKRKPVILKPGELLQTSDKQPQQLLHKAVQPDAYAAWRDDKMVFNKTPLAELVLRLRDTYGVEVTVKNPELNQRKLTGTIPLSDLDLLCETLAATFHLRAEHHQNSIILSN